MKSKNKFVTTRNISLYDIFDGTTLEEAIINLRTYTPDLSEYSNYTNVRGTYELDYDDGQVSVLYTVKREETDEEYNSRLLREEAEKQTATMLEYQRYLILKEKFEK